MKKRKDYRTLGDVEKQAVEVAMEKEFPGTNFGDDFIKDNVRQGFRCHDCFTISCICKQVIE